MKLINRWPLADDFDLPQETVNDVMNLLLEPFDNEEAAKALWRELGTTLIVIDPDDSLESLQRFSHSIVEQIRFALRHPELEDSVAHGYQLILSITNDEGGGIYLLIALDASLLSEIHHD